MNRLSVRTLDPPGLVDARRLRTVGLTAIRALGPAPGAPGGRERCHDITCHLVADARMARLNREHLDHAGPTDVITFDYGAPETASPGEEWLRGDILIDWEVARRQAREYGTTATEEIVRYLVHGFLHLQGHDDLAPAPRRIMKREENRLVRLLGRRFDFARLRRH